MRWLIRICLFGVALSAVVSACGSHDAKKRSPGDAGGQGGVGPSPPALADAGLGGQITPTGGGAETAEAGAGGVFVVPSPQGGVGGDVTSCAETCDTGACVFDACLPTTTVNTQVNLTTTTISDGRVCAEAPAFAVTALSANGATLDAPATDDCLLPGDEVLLINLQGTPSANVNVGAWELLRVATVVDDTVSFSRAKQRRYGATVTADDRIGTTMGSQRVALIRVPRYGVLDVTETGSITGNPWDGQLGGVVALRAGKLNVAGHIDADALGYRPGRWSEDNIVCTRSTATEAGESISGPGSIGTARNLGASGGLSAADISFNKNTPVLGTPGHALAGEAGSNPQGRTLGPPGNTYGSADGARLTMGSGPGGGLRCTEEDHPVRLVVMPGQAGGIVLLLADELSVTETGSISASPAAADRDIAFAGGYVLLRGSTLSLGERRVTALGSTGGGINGPTATFRNHASPGYIVLDAVSVSGTTEPAATEL